MKYSRISLLLPAAVLLLSGCHQVLATEDSKGEGLTIHQEAANYRQVISLKQSIEPKRATEKKAILLSHTITEATLFPREGEGFGTRILKKAEADPIKWDIHATNEGAHQQKNNGEWVASATADPLFATLEVYSYETFVELAELFLERGQLTETRQEYTIAYSGSDSDLNSRIALLLNQFPTTGTLYEAAITVDKQNRHVTSFELSIEQEEAKNGDSYRQEIEAAFHKFDSNTLPEKPKK